MYISEYVNINYCAKLSRAPNWAITRKKNCNFDSFKGNVGINTFGKSHFQTNWASCLFSNSVSPEMPFAKRFDANICK